MGARAVRGGKPVMCFLIDVLTSEVFDREEFDNGDKIRRLDVAYKAYFRGRVRGLLMHLGVVCSRLEVYSR